ncbi:hypothetical protein [Parasutterella excrementihominis]|uniref:hypothetical protein n=1 Tax=Parasutterella excrementihominis TaxID=487175 RepID=UPI003AAFABD5
MTKTLRYFVGLSKNADDRFFSAAADEHCDGRFLESNGTRDSYLGVPAHVDSDNFFADSDITKISETFQDFSRAAPLVFVSNENKRNSYSSLILSFGSVCLAEFGNCCSQILNFVRCSFNSLYKFPSLFAAFSGKEEAYGRNNAGKESTQENQNITTFFLLVDSCQKTKKQNNSNSKEYEQDFTNEFFGIEHCFFLRELISDLSLATKFYSLPRRPNFLGLLVSKSRQAHYPRLSDSLKRSSALLKFLNSLVPFSFGYINPCRHLFSFFGNRTDFSAALFFIPDRRLYE